MYRELRKRAAEGLVRYLFRRNPNVFPDDIAASLFHRLYYHRPDTWMKNTFLGLGVSQSPFDLYLYQELIHRLRPNFILQTGVANGGSALYFATLLDIIGAPPEDIYIGVDLTLSPTARGLRHRRIHLIEGDSTSPDVLLQVEALTGGRKGLVSLDSDHRKEHVAKEIALYKKFVAVASYLVVEDANIGSHTVCQGFGPGPREALDEFLKTNDEFVADNSLWQRNVISFHQFGWLKRVRPD